MDAHNLPPGPEAHGLIVPAPGETLAAECCFRVTRVRIEERPAMRAPIRVTDIRATTVTVPLEGGVRHANGCHWGRFVRTIVEVDTDVGITGLGEMGGGGESADASLALLKKVWEKLIRCGETLMYENRIDHFASRKSIVRTTSSMTTEEVLQALDRYARDSNQSDRRMATQLGISRVTLSDWLGGKDQPQKCVLARVAGFLRRVGYL